MSNKIYIMYKMYILEIPEIQTDQSHKKSISQYKLLFSNCEVGHSIISHVIAF